MRSRDARYFYLSSDPQYISGPGHKPTVSIQQGENLEHVLSINNSEYILCTIIKNVMISATEAQIVAVFQNVQDTMEFMEYPQLTATIQVDNECALEILTDPVKQRRSKVIYIYTCVFIG